MKNFPLLFCVLFSVCAATTSHAINKSEQVERYLGTFRYKNDHPRGTVKFVFQKAVLKRQGDGKKNYEQLLFNERYFSNSDNAGRLLAIQIVYKGKTSTIRPESPKDPEEVADEEAAPKPSRPKVAERRAARKPRPEPKTIQVTSAAAAATALASDPVRPRQNEAPPPSSGLSLPDSSTPSSFRSMTRPPLRVNANDAAPAAWARRLTSSTPARHPAAELTLRSEIP